MARPGRTAALSLVALLLVPGCRFHMAQVEVRRPFSQADFEAVDVDGDDRARLLAELGPPDRLTYTLGEEIHEYEAGRHRGTDLRFFVPGELVRVPGLGAVSGILRFFFGAFEEPEEFHSAFEVTAGRAAIGAVAGLVPFAGGQDVLTLRGRQLRHDRIRVVVDRDTLRVEQKALLRATQDLDQQSILERATLRAD
jgi:hypothetical protein